MNSEFEVSTRPVPFFASKIGRQLPQHWGFDSETEIASTALIPDCVSVASKAPALRRAFLGGLAAATLADYGFCNLKVATYTDSARAAYHQPLLQRRNSVSPALVMQRSDVLKSALIIPSGMLLTWMELMAEEESLGH